MDDAVLRAMRRWPDVPSVHGWLRLDRRGRWMLVDRGHPDFDEARDGGGSPITHPGIVAFISRNYRGDERGRWYWQNGPQRVFVDLEIAPLILRVLGDGADARLIAHTAEPVARVDAVWRTAEGDLLLATDLGPGAVHGLDLASLDLRGDDGHGHPTQLALHGREIGILSPQHAPDPRFERRPRPD